MNPDTAPGPTCGAVDRWLAHQREALNRNLAEVLDVEAGLDEILVPVGAHRDLACNLGSVVDVEAGLAAILPDGPATSPGRQVAGKRAADRAVSALLIKMMEEVDPRTRLAIRNGPAVASLADALGFALDLLQIRSWALELTIQDEVHNISQPISEALLSALWPLDGEGCDVEDVQEVSNVSHDEDGFFSLNEVIARIVDCDSVGRGTFLRYSRLKYVRHAREVVRRLNRALDRVSELDCAFAVAEGLLYRDIAWVLDVDLVIARDSARALAYDQNTGADFADALTNDLIDALDRASHSARVLVGTGIASMVNRLRRTGGSAVTSLRDVALTDLLEDVTTTSSSDIERTLTAVSRLRDDFIGADLRTADLSESELAGVRWSDSTRWPDDWFPLVRRASFKVSPGIYEIQHGGHDWRNTPGHRPVAV